jgi:hypothetical protein
MTVVGLDMTHDTMWMPALVRFWDRVILKPNSTGACASGSTVTRAVRNGARDGSCRHQNVVIRRNFSHAMAFSC